MPESLAQCLTLNTLTLWNCQVLERLPDLTPIPKLQIDGVPEQLAEWEQEQKRKRAEDAKSGANKGQVQQAAKSSGWAAVKKGHALIGTAASLAGQAKTREQLATARGEADKSTKSSPPKPEQPSAASASGE